MRDAGLPSKHRSGGQRVPEHPARGLEARADGQLDRVRSAVSVSGEWCGHGTVASTRLTSIVPHIGTEPRGSAQQGGGRRAEVEPPPVRAQRGEGDARQLHWRHVLRVLPQVILKIPGVDMRVLDHPDVGRPHLLHQLIMAASAGGGNLGLMSCVRADASDQHICWMRHRIGTPITHQTHADHHQIH